MLDAPPVAVVSPARATVTRLREQLLALGVDEETVRQVVPLTDLGDRPHVRLGTWPAADAERLVAILATLPAEPPR